MRPAVTDKLQQLPPSPGVYLMRDHKGEVFYVGKAKSLRDRVRSYFSGSDTRAFVALLDDLLADIEVILTQSEKEALLVEDELIKRHQPRYNVILKDDKRFLCLRLDMRQSYPRLDVVRRFAKDGVKYFGPYHSAQSIRQTLGIVNRHFQLRTCSDQMLRGRSRPCLQYQIKRCPAPCVRDLADGEYAENVENVTRFLEGRGEELIASLHKRMAEQAHSMNYESAAQVRDQITAVQKSLEQQEVVSSDFEDRDCIGLYRQGQAIEIHVMRSREGRLRDAQRFSFNNAEVPTAEVLGDFAVRYYGEKAEIPDEILFPKEMLWTDALAELLTDRRARRVKVAVPKRGKKRRLVELAMRNAHQAFQDKQRQAGAAKAAIERLQRSLHLARLPERIECFDISHLQGSQIVASAVRFDNGEPRKDLYRHYKIRSTSTQDDFKSMYEVVSRRARRGLEEADLPDLIVIDGGKGQLAAAKAALDDHGIDGVELIGLAKARPPTSSAQGPGKSASSPQSPAHTKGGGGVPERVFVAGQKNPVILRPDSGELFVLTRARDEAHRFAIAFHRRLRSKAATRGALDGIPGVGPKRRGDLLRAFRSVAGVKRASLAELADVVGPKLARVIKESL